MVKKTKKHKTKNPPLWIAITLFLSMIGGIFASVVGISEIENYYHPYVFGFICGGFGIIVGLIVANYMKPIIAVNHKIKSNYGMTKMYISVGFIGLFLLLGTTINRNLSHLDQHVSCIITDKYRQESRFRSPEINSLVVNINGDTKRLVCSRKYWFRTRVGQRIGLSLYESSIGFNYIEIANDK
jgi:dipeptide/tripeptide permease